MSGRAGGSRLVFYRLMMLRWTVGAAGAAIALVAAGGLGVDGVLAQRGGLAKPLRMYVFDCGTLKNRDPAPYGLTRQQVDPDQLDMADPCFLITHPRGTLLWETGLNDAEFNRAEGGGAQHDKVDISLKSQLSGIGYTPADITYLAISHIHGDHSGNANDYAGSTWIAQKREREAMFAENMPPNLQALAKNYGALKDSKTVLIDGDHDVFGDGTVMLVFTPGHTAGHQSLLVKLSRTGAVFLSGDLYHYPIERTLHVPARGRFQEQFEASKAKVEKLLSETHATLWIQHDKVANAARKMSPKYYD
jgi:glyoxylase-like metal-dependent hydrolase (beta-lactamase superfamily II)